MTPTPFDAWLATSDGETLDEFTERQMVADLARAQAVAVAKEYLRAHLNLPPGDSRYDSTLDALSAEVIYRSRHYGDEWRVDPVVLAEVVHRWLNHWKVRSA